MRFDTIPDELTTLPRWVCVWNNSKIPMQATTRKGASSVKAETWSTFADARDAVLRGEYDYTGFVFDDDGIIGIDIDCGFDTDGFLSAISVDCMSACASYTELSRSGRGIHIYVKGTLPFKGKNNGMGLEIYRDSRYFIVTGEKLIYNKIIENQEAIDYIVCKYFTDIQNERETSTRQCIYSPYYDSLATDGKISLQPVYPAIPQGMRNISLTSLAGQLHQRGYSKGDIFRELLRANGMACTPPLSPTEVQLICDSVTKYRR